jgi:hypothetical protein
MGELTINGHFHQFSVAMLNYQRVNPMISPISPIKKPFPSGQQQPNFFARLVPDEVIFSVMAGLR